MSELKPLVIYHGNCPDGFGAAYAAYLHFRRRDDGLVGEFFPARHGDPPPPCARREVYILDFSYKREVMRGLCAQAASVVVLDHHISAQQDLAGLEQECPNLRAQFDMNKSGAILAWEYFHTEAPPPLLLYIQDRDLWRNQMPDSEEVLAALMSRPFDFELWHGLAGSAEALVSLRREGEAINRYRQQMIARYKQRAVMGSIAGHPVPVVNCPRSIASELLGELAQQHPFAAGYEDSGNRRSWSLRSRGEGGLDVARIAAHFGGGGHRNAAGFNTELPASLLSLE